jgi:hypothetical protein
MKNQKLYRIWKQIKTRCFNKNNSGYKHYGNRGITISSDWVNNFPEFEKYIISLPNYNPLNIGRGGITLDRYDNNGNYEKGNLRWVTMEIQTRNRRKKSGNLSSIYTGISYDNSGIRIKRWRARISINKQIIVLGRFETELEAKNFRDKYISENKLEGFIIN